MTAHTEPTVPDQSRLARSRILTAQTFDRHRAAHNPPDPHDAADWLLDQLQAHGWTPPPDPAADTPPPARPAQPADDNSPGRREYRASLCRQYGHRPDGHTCGRCGARQTDATQPNQRDEAGQ